MVWARAEHPGPRNDWGLQSRQADHISNLKVGNGFLQFGNGWRLCNYDDTHMSLTHIKRCRGSKIGCTAMIWRSDGTEHAGPRKDFNCWESKFNFKAPGGVHYGEGFIELSSKRGPGWRIGRVDG